MIHDQSPDTALDIGHHRWAGPCHFLPRFYDLAPRFPAHRDLFSQIARRDGNALVDSMRTAGVFFGDAKRDDTVRGFHGDFQKTV